MKSDLMFWLLFLVLVFVGVFIGITHPGIVR
jgi:hypothetical protein